MRVVVDTNVLVSFVTDRDLAQQKRAGDLLERAARGDLELILPQSVLAELVYVLRNLYEVPPEDTASILEDLLALPGTRPEHDLAWSAVLSSWPGTYRDFGDAILAAVSSSHRAEVATFDQGFGRALRREGLAVHW